jgi:putative selenium metabolism protein SsnA
MKCKLIINGYRLMHLPIIVLITNGVVITMTEPNRVVQNGALLVLDGAITDIGPAAELEARHADLIRTQPVLDAQGKVILPGNICAHTHFYGAFARGMAIPGDPPRNFVEVLEKLWWKLDRALDLDGVKYSALVCLVDAIKNGTTTLIDHHASPNAIEGSLDAIADAVITSGLRAALCYEVTDRNGFDGARRGIAENVAFAKSRVTGHRSRVKAALGIHASFTVSNETVDECAKEATALGIPIHIHVAEDIADEDDSLSKYGVPVVERLAMHGALNGKTICAHCIHIGDGEMDMLAQHGAKVTHQPRSNMNNGVGVARVGAMLERGICVGLGNDGFSNDAFAEMKACDLLHKVHALDPRAMGAEKVTHMTYQNNAEIARLFWPEARGVLEVGAPADIILMDYTPFTQLHAGNVPWHMLFGMSGGMVTHTIVGGEVLMADRQLLTLDEAEIAAKAREAADRAWVRVKGV